MEVFSFSNPSTQISDAAVAEILTEIPTFIYVKSSSMENRKRPHHEITVEKDSTPQCKSPVISDINTDDQSNGKDDMRNKSWIHNSHFYSIRQKRCRFINLSPETYKPKAIRQERLVVSDTPCAYCGTHATPEWRNGPDKLR